MRECGGVQTTEPHTPLLGSFVACSKNSRDLGVVYGCRGEKLIRHVCFNKQRFHGCFQQDMRVSLRKAVKIAALLTILLLMNIFIGFKLSFLGIENSENSEKLLRHIKHDNGEQVSSELHHAFTDHDVQSRLQRSAKSVPRSILIDKLNPAGVDADASSPGEKKKKLSTELAASQTLSHGRQTPETGLADIFISVKTSGKFHASRLQLVLKTWYLLARDQTYFFSDKDDHTISEATGGHLINTNCTPSHTRPSLICKTSVEFDAYLASKKRWMCHFDDDTYVNIPELVDLLRGYKHTEDWYLGKPSLRFPIEINDVYNPGAKVAFWFATGSGFCISRGLALKMMPYAGGGRLKAIGEKLRLPDDCVIGYIVEHQLKRQLTVIEGFRSHLEALWLLKPSQLQKQITLSYSTYGDKENVVNVSGFSLEEDPTRMMSIHCHLFPTFRECKAIQH